MLIVADRDLAWILGPPADAAGVDLLWTGENDEIPLRRKPLSEFEDRSQPDRPVCISFTSGTTGPPKGVVLTDRSLRACADGVRNVVGATPDDRLLLWEPIYHAGGSQILVHGVLSGAPFVLVDAFHASLFWDWVDRYRITHLHYLGGVLQILLRTGDGRPPPGSTLRVAWGGGCPSEIWEAVRTALGVEIREVYGMTETASIATVNRGGPIGSVGRALGYVDVEVRGADGQKLRPGDRGEIVVRAHRDNVLMSGYFNAPELSAAVMRGGWLHTGDAGSLDADGYLYFHGRLSDGARVRGENVSSWEVESILIDHPAVVECAMIGVPAEVGEEEIAVFLRVTPGTVLDPEALLSWCASRMPRYQVPRYVGVVDAFEHTPTQRVVKELLRPLVSQAWDSRRAVDPA